MELLATEDIGRVAVVFDHYPHVFPVHYRLDDYVVVFRAQPGTRSVQAHHHNVGFEVDRLDPASGTGWTVLVLGMAENIAGRHPDVVTERAQKLDVGSWVDGESWLVRIVAAHITGWRIGVGSLP